MHLKFRPLEVLMTVFLLIIYVVFIIIVSLPDIIFGYRGTNYERRF